MIKIRPLERKMLDVLLNHQGQTVTREMIFNELYGGVNEPEYKIIDVTICTLRHKLQTNDIETVYGIGYRLNPEFDVNKIVFI